MPNRYQLVDLCVFVDSTNTETGKRQPKEIPLPHILDQRDNPPTHLKLNDGAAYITRFIVMGVDTALIPEIIKSEYKTTLGKKVDTMDFVAEVEAVVKMLFPKYLMAREHSREYEAPKQYGTDTHQAVDREGKPTKGYELDFKVNWIASSCCKVPIG